MLSQRAISRVFNANTAINISFIYSKRFGFCHATFSNTLLGVFVYHFQLSVYYLFILHSIAEVSIDLSIVFERFLVFFSNLVLSVVLAAARGLLGHAVVADGDH